MPDRVATGRAGRSSLIRRLGAARRAVRLLDRKLRILEAEQTRARRTAEQAADAWRTAAGELDRALIHADLAGGHRAVRLATPAGAATVVIRRRAVTGLRLAEAAAVSTVPPEPCGAVTAAAAAAAREALVAAARSALASAAVRVLDGEAARTRRRHHAVADRWLPEHEEALRRLDERLDEEDRAELVRCRWAAGRLSGSRW